MSTNRSADGFEAAELGWRADAPRARAAAMALYSWREPGWVFFWAAGAAALFAAAAAFAPALLSLSPTVDMIGPIAEARAVTAGEASLAIHDAPFYLLLLALGDLFTALPGRVHLMAKAFGALVVMLPFAFLATTRFPALYAGLATAALAAFVAAPFADASELGLAMFVVCGLAFVSMSADETAGRAGAEGAVGGAALAVLWLLNPVFALAGFILLSACPFLTGRYGLPRYAAALATFAAIAGLVELTAPGMNAARALAASETVRIETIIAGGENAVGFGAAAYGALLVIVSSAVFGGRAHRKNWLAAAGLMIVGLLAARLTGANALPVFAVAAGLACFSVASPFYDGLFRDHDRASVASALTAAGLTLFWTGAIVVHAIGQFSMQQHVAARAPEDIRTKLALVQPGGPTIATWVEEGRFSTPEAREFFALTPVDQSAMLLEAASRARQLAGAGVEVAFLTGSDTACILASARECRADGPAAANAANVVFVPRLDLDPKTAAAKGRSEALLYTQFRMVEQTALWEIWVRRDAPGPAKLFPLADAQYR